MIFSGASDDGFAGEVEQKASQLMVVSSVIGEQRLLVAGWDADFMMTVGRGNPGRYSLWNYEKTLRMI